MAKATGFCIDCGIAISKMGGRVRCDKHSWRNRAARKRTTGKVSKGIKHALTESERAAQLWKRIENEKRVK